jgi:hypothetical protein
MDFSFRIIDQSERFIEKYTSLVRALIVPFGKNYSRSFFISSSIFLLGLLPCAFAYAAGDASVGRFNWEYTCQHCHGTPQPNSSAAFSDYDTTANRLSVYASDPAAITKAANEGYIIPEGNSNDKAEPGKSTKVAMGTWAGLAPNRLGLGATPTQYAIDFAAYFATLFHPPESPAIVAVTPGSGLASVGFTAPKSDLTVTSYTVTVQPGGTTVTGTASPIIVPGLSNGTPYTFTVTATSNAGSGKPSASSNVITLTSPIASVAIAAASKKVVPLKAPPLAAQATTVVSGAPSVLNSAQTTVAKSVSPAAPANIVAPVKSALPSGPTTQSAALMAPTIKFARAGNAQVRVFFEAPAGGASITGYTVSAFINGAPAGIKTTGTTSPVTVSGLTNGTEYTFTVTSNSRASMSVESAHTNSVTPLRMLGD